MSLQARFQQKQMQEKEEKLLRLYENQQQKAFEKVGRGSAGSNTSVGSNGGGKVRQMFDERRQKAGIDKSYPLEPLKQKNGTTRGNSLDRKVTTTTRIVAKSMTQKSVTHIKDGKPLISKREVVQRIYNNNNGDERFEEHRHENDDLLPRKDSHRHLVDMTNKHNLDDCLDNEEMPQIAFEEPDEILHKAKPANLGRKLPSENSATRNAVEKRNLVIKPSGGALGSTRKEPKAIAKKPLKASSPAKTVSSSSAISPISRNSTPTSPSKNMDPNRSKTPSVPTNRAPNSTRPSAKQGAKSGVVRDDLAECKFCGRNFAVDRLDKHEEICSKSAKKKRKVYDATKHRVQGTELEGYVTKKVKSTMSKPSKISSSKKDWRRTHEEFIATIRAAKQAQAYVAKGGKLADLPPPPPSSNPDYVQCPHCGRRFNEAAAARHIPKCANYEYNKPKAGATVQKGRK